MFLCKRLFYGGKRTQAVALGLSAGSQPQIFSPPRSTNGCLEALARIERNYFYLCIVWPIPKWKWCHVISFKLLPSHSPFNLFRSAVPGHSYWQILWSIQCNDLSAPDQWLQKRNDLTQLSHGFKSNEAQRFHSIIWCSITDCRRRVARSVKPLLKLFLAKANGTHLVETQQILSNWNSSGLEHG